MGCLTRQKLCSQTRRYRFGPLRCRLISRAAPAPALLFDHIRIIFEYLTIPRAPASKRNNRRVRGPAKQLPARKMAAPGNPGAAIGRERQVNQLPKTGALHSPHMTSGFPSARDCPERRAAYLQTLRRAQVPQVAVKEERRVLKVRKRRLKGKVGCLSAPEPVIRCRRRSVESPTTCPQ